MPGAIPLRPARIAVAIAFAMQGFLLAALLTQLPQYKDRFDLPESIVVVAVVTVSAIAGLGSVVAEMLARRTSSKSALVMGLAVISAAGVAIGIAPSTWVFFTLLGVYGAGLGMVDAAANMQAVALQHRYGRFILSSFHAAWSAGAIAGALFVAATAGLGVSTTLAQVCAGLCVATALVGTAHRFLPDTSSDTSGQPAPAAVTGATKTSATNTATMMPTRLLLALGAAMALFYAVDFGVANWSAMYLQDVLLANSGTAALALAAYQCAALVSRTTGDWWVRRHGEVLVVRVGAGIGFVGMSMVVLAQSPAVAITGFLILGVGAPVVVPLCFSAAGGAAPPGQADAVVARINLFNYAGTLVGGGVVGAVGALTELRIGFVVPLAFIVALFCLAPAFAPRSDTVRGLTPAQRTSDNARPLPERAHNGRRQR